MTPEEKAAEEFANKFNAQVEKVEALNKEVESLKEAGKSNATLEAALKTAQDSLKALEDFKTKAEADLADMATKLETSEKNALPTADPLLAQVVKHKEGLAKSGATKGRTSYEFDINKTDFVRSTGVVNSTDAFRLDSIGQVAHRKLSLYDLFPKVPVGPGSNGVIRYSDWSTATRAAAAIAEAGTFPESTAVFTEYSLTLEKIGDTMAMSEETLQDLPRFTRELDLFLNTNVRLKVDADLYSANGSTPNIKGVKTYAATYSAAAAGITDASIYDLIVKMQETIMKGYNSKYSPNFVLMNMTDINKMMLKKDANYNYVLPPFVSRDGKQVNGLMVIESNNVTANTLTMGDSRFGTIYEVEGYNVTTGYGDGQFITDMLTVKAKQRLALLIRTADAGGFLHCTSISAALTTLAS